MTEAEEIKVYVDYIARWYGIKPTAEIAESLDLSCEQIELIVDEVPFPSFVKFKVAVGIPRANKEQHTCQIIPFMGRLTNND
jgi:hypothetical protein